MASGSATIDGANEKLKSNIYETKNIDNEIFELIIQLLMLYRLMGSPSSSADGMIWYRYQPPLS